VSQNYSADEIGVSDDWPTGFAQVPDWITLHPDLKAQSVREYAFLAMHAPKDGRRRVAFPGQASIARCLQLGRSDKVTPYTRALEKAGAVRVEEIATPKGRAYRYVLRFNPPPSYTGPRSLSDFYGIREPEVDDRWADWSMATAPVKEAGQGGSPQKEGYPSPQKEGDPSPQKGGSKKTSANQTSGTTAPSARSAGDVRRTGAGSSARGRSGSAAPGTAESSSGKAGKALPEQQGEDKLTREQAAAVRAVEALLPPLLASKLPYGHIPKRNRAAVLEALESRTVDQLRERISRRWTAYGYEPAIHDDTLRSAVGTALELIAPTRHCPNLACEDGELVDTGQDCRACIERTARRRADRLAGKAPAPASKSTASAVECLDCGHPFPGRVPADRLCKLCREVPAAAVAALAARIEHEAAARREAEELEQEAQRRRARRAAAATGEIPAVEDARQEQAGADTAAEGARLRAELLAANPWMTDYAQTPAAASQAPAPF
jgi:hypothetical protein